MPFDAIPVSDAAARATILVVDDDAAARGIARQTFESLHDVVEADDISAALSLMARQRVDLVLLNLAPGADGLAGCRAMKAASKEYLPVLLLSALGRQEERNAGLEAGGDDFLVKPVDGHELVLRAAKFLELRRHERALRELAALRDGLVNQLVHDLRNPLAAALSALRFLVREVGDADAEEDARLALDSAQKVNELLDDVVHVRMLEEGTLTLAPEVMSAGALVRDATEPLRQMAAERRVTLEVNAALEVTASLDRRLVRRAVQNLVTNALKYTRKQVRVDVVQRGPGVEVHVTDYGLGVPDEVKLVLFEKYGTVGPRFANTRRGVGVGLYLVRLVAVAHGGDVAVEDSEGGAGTVLRLSLGSLT